MATRRGEKRFPGRRVESPLVQAPTAPSTVPAAVVAPVRPLHDWLTVAALLAIAAVFFADVLAGTSNFYLRDLTSYYYPAKKVLREIVYGGEFPYWNRLFSAGQPMAANPEHEVFYPLTWLLFLPDYDIGYRLHILIHIWIGLAGMYALLRSMELRPAAAFFGASSFGLGGMYLSYVNLLPILFCAAWLPLTCLYVRRFLFNGRGLDFALAALFLGLQFLVAEPTTVMQTGLLIGAYALYRGWHSERRLPSMSRNVLAIAVVSVAAFAAGAAQMLPAIDHARDSVRTRGFDFGIVQQWSLPWTRLAELIYPNVMGHISVEGRMRYWGGGLYRLVGSPFLFSIYPGLAVTTLAIGGVATRSRGSRFVLSLVVFSVLISLGSNTPLLEALFDAGVARSIRYPEKFMMIALFTITVFAAQMFQRLIDGDRRLRAATAGFALSTVVLAAVVAVVNGSDAPAFARLWGLQNEASLAFMADLAWNDWRIAAARGLLLFGLLLTMPAGKWRLWSAGAFVFLMADLLSVAHQITPRISSDFFTRPPSVVSSLAANRQDYRVFHEAEWYGHLEISRKYYSTGAGGQWVTRNGLFPMTTCEQGFALVLERDFDKTALLPTVDLVTSMWAFQRAGRRDLVELIMSMSNVWYRAVYRNFEEEMARVKEDFSRVLPISFVEGPHYPRYYFAEEIIQISDLEDFVRQLTTRSLRPAPRAFIHEPSFKPGRGRVLGLSESSNEATIEVESYGQGFLVMSVTPHKYWQIFIDDKPVKALITNIGYQGVRMPPGRHSVTMRYRNPLIPIGAIISAATVSILLILAFSAAGRRPRRLG